MNQFVCELPVGTEVVVHHPRRYIKVPVTEDAFKLFGKSFAKRGFCLLKNAETGEYLPVPYAAAVHDGVLVYKSSLR